MNCCKRVTLLYKLFKYNCNFLNKKKYFNNSTGTILKSYDDIPGPNMYPIVGNLFETTELGKI